MFNLNLLSTRQSLAVAGTKSTKLGMTKVCLT